jgi:hypothetical protein
MKIIFLDVDGVINSSRSHNACKRAREKQFALFMPGDDDYLSALTKASIDPIAVELINFCAERADAKFVISSSHRLFFQNEVSLDRIKKYFLDLGIDAERIIGITPYLPNNPRGDEIQQWLDAHPEVTHYVIIDDSIDMLESQKKNFVLTTMENGFSYENFKKVVNLLDARSSR